MGKSSAYKRASTNNKLNDEVKMVYRSTKNRTFEELLEHKRKKYGLTENEAYKGIIRSSTTTNEKYDKIAGIQ